MRLQMFATSPCVRNRLTTESLECGDIWRSVVMMASLMPTESTQPKLRTAIYRVFGLEPREYSAVGWSFLYFFCVLSSYYILRSVRETMAVMSGPETIPWLFFGTFVTMLLATPIFGWIASRYPRKRFLPWVYYFFAANILILWILFSYMIGRDLEYVWLARAFFVWLSVFNLYVVSVFWSFMADIYTRDQGRRLFGLITSGGSLGTIAGSGFTSLAVVPMGFENVLPFSAVLLTLAAFCISRLRRWVEREHPDDIADSVAGNKPLGGNPFAGITQVLSSKYLSAIVASLLIANLLGTALYMFTAQLVETAIADADQRTQFFSNINLLVGVLAFIGQMFLVRQVVGKLGVGVSLSMLPLVSVVGFAALALEPSLIVAGILTVVRRSLNFGFSKPTSDMLYSVVTPEQKYKAKNFIDTAVYRSGDLIGTWFIKGILGLGIAGVSLVMLPFAAVWALIALWIGRDYRRRDRLANQGVSP